MILNRLHGGYYCMKIGTLLVLETKDPDEETNWEFRCKVIEKNEHYLFIDYPIDNKTNKSALIPKHKPFTVTYVGSDQSVYSFPSEIVAQVKLNVPALAIPMPEKQHINRIQRREFVRIVAAIDVSVHSLETSSTPFTTVTNDISGGGLSIVLPKGVTLTEGEGLDLWFVLPMESGDYQYINAQSEVVRMLFLENTVQTASLKFTGITKQSCQQIIRFCFERQRELRKKELL
ncbi:pilus assembly protein PilZ [Virgibacillus dakarensis]|nr:pilus assembly protein PilZ [Virgibacillus dakarensis]